MSENKIVRTNFMWSYSQKIGQTIIGILIAAILARIISPAENGLIVFSLSINAVAGMFLNFGFSSAIVQQKEVNQQQLSSVFFFNMVLATSIMLLLMSVAGFLAQYYENSVLQNVIIVSSISFVFNAANIVPVGMLTRQMRYKTIAIRSLISTILSGSIGVTMAYNGYGVWSIVIQQLGYVVFNTIGNYLATKWWPIWYYQFGSIRHMFNFGFFMFLSGMLDSIYSKLDYFIIAKVFKFGSLGQYGRAQMFDTQLRDLTSSSIIGVLFPLFAQKRDDKQALQTMYETYFEMVTLIFCLFSGAMFLAAGFVFHILFGSQWTESVFYFKIFIIAGFAYPLSSLSLSIIESRGNSKNFLKVEVLKKILFLPTYFIAYYHGIIPYLYSYLIACFIGTFLNVKFVNFEIPFNFKKIVLTFFSYYIPAAIIIGVLYFIFSKYTLITTEIDGVIAAILFFGTYFLLQYYTKSKGLQYLKAFLFK